MNLEKFGEKNRNSLSENRENREIRNGNSDIRDEIVENVESFDVVVRNSFARELFALLLFTLIKLCAITLNETRPQSSGERRE